MSTQNQALKCPLCGGNIKKVSGDAQLIKCEKNLYQGGKHSGCNFFMNLSPKPLSGYIFNREEISKMLNGETVEIEGIKANYDNKSQFNPILTFPPLEDF